MTGDLKFSNAVFGFGAGIFFIGYFLLQIPGTMLIELWSARKFLGATLIVWGGLATLTGLHHQRAAVLLDPLFPRRGRSRILSRRHRLPHALVSV